MERSAMRQQERDWLGWLRHTRDAQMTQRQALGEPAAEADGVHRRAAAADGAEQRRQAGRLTQVGRALCEPGIRRIPAHSLQAKSRVEMSFGVGQGRLAKHLRLAQVNPIQAATVPGGHGVSQKHDF